MSWWSYVILLTQLLFLYSFIDDDDYTNLTLSALNVHAGAYIQYDAGLGDDLSKDGTQALDDDESESIMPFPEDQKDSARMIGSSRFRLPALRPSLGMPGLPVRCGLRSTGFLSEMLSRSSTHGALFSILRHNQMRLRNFAGSAKRNTKFTVLLAKKLRLLRGACLD